MSKKPGSGRRPSPEEAKAAPRLRSADGGETVIVASSAVAKENTQSDYYYAKDHPVPDEEVESVAAE